MKNILYLLFFGIHLINAQYTLIPNQQFEQILINQNIDSENILDGRVLTTDINELTELNVNGYFLSDITGIEDFVSLEFLDCSGNELQTLDVTNLTLLKYLICGDYNELNGIDLQYNTELITFNSQHDAEDVGGNAFGEIDFSNNLKLENIYINYAIYGNLDLSNHYFLKNLNFKHNGLLSIDLRNGFNENITLFNTTFSQPNCVYVDDKTASYLDTWQIDNETTFVETEAECNALAVSDFTKNKISVYPNPINNIIHIDTQNTEIEKIIIYNQLGRQLVVFKTNEYDLSNLKNGLYILVITIKNDVLISKIVKN